jgi:hypothetical protein
MVATQRRRGQDNRCAPPQHRHKAGVGRGKSQKGRSGGYAHLTQAGVGGKNIRGGPEATVGRRAKGQRSVDRYTARRRAWSGGAAPMGTSAMCRMSPKGAELWSTGRGSGGALARGEVGRIRQKRIAERRAGEVWEVWHWDAFQLCGAHWHSEQQLGRFSTRVWVGGDSANKLRAVLHAAQGSWLGS